MNLADVSIRRPVFAAMLILALVVLGLVSVGRLEMQLDPDIEFPVAWVTTELRGASPEKRFQSSYTAQLMRFCESLNHSKCSSCV